jgi:hypothetical protein
MHRCFLSLAVVSLGGLCLGLLQLGQSAEKTAAERGRDIMFGRSLNPAVWSLKAYENAWKQWGVSEKPAEYESAFMERYGLHRAPFDNKGRPMGLLEAKSLLGKGIVNNCLLCHAGTVAGQTIIGLGNASLDLQSLFEDLSAADGFKMEMPFRFSYVRGTIDPVNPLTFLMEYRDPELELLKQPIKLGYSRNVSSDPPAWWLLKKKKTRDWTGGIDARSTRVDMVNLLTPLNSGTYIRQQESAFADIAAFLLTIEPPKYPFSVDEKLAERGRSLFVATCAKCHGTYGPGAEYPNKIVELGTIGTDATLAESLTTQLGEHFNKSWLAREIGPDGKPFRLMDNLGYQAPPLDGVWATAPYFHNSSAPTIYHVLNSKARPKFYTRSYKTGKEDYDPVKLGLRITVLERAPGADVPARERRQVYDTTLPGQSNEGHIFGDKFTEEERMAVIEYLKTL